MPLIFGLKIPCPINSYRLFVPVTTDDVIAHTIFGTRYCKTHFQELLGIEGSLN